MYNFLRQGARNNLPQGLDLPRFADTRRRMLPRENPCRLRTDGVSSVTLYDSSTLLSDP